MKNRLAIFLFTALCSILFIYLFILKDNTKDNKNYQHNFVILNKSFSKDLERSVNLYISFEKHFKGFEDVPFIIIIPASDLSLFNKRFEQEKPNLKKLPIIKTDEEILFKTGEPLPLNNGWWTQQVIKLCFGLTDYSRYYFIIDSDIYFTKDYDWHKELIFKDNLAPFFLTNSCLSKDEIESEKLKAYSTRDRIEWSFYGVKSLVKSILGSSDDCYRGYVLGYQIFDSEIIKQLKDHIRERGVHSFTHLITLVPFEFQWYGEYLNMQKKINSAYPIFSYYGLDNSYCRSESNVEDPRSFGIWFQSIDYENDKKRNPKARYERSTQCDVQKK